VAEPDRASFEVILDEAEERLWSVFRRSTRLQHRGTKGRVREDGVARFLREQLPSRFAVHEGEAIDTRDRRSTQLDVVVFDGANVSPLWVDEYTVLIPAECLLAVVEVKTKLTREEYVNCCRAIKSLAALEPHGQPFIPARTLGAHADDSRLRCFYTILAFSTDVGEQNWAQKEWNRFLEVCAEEEVDPSRFDRVLVLERGMMIPPRSAVRVVAESGSRRLFGHWFVHLTQFLTREANRRQPFEWTPYREQGAGWMELTPTVPTLAEPTPNGTAADRAADAAKKARARRKPKPKAKPKPRAKRPPRQR
jgi:hypothetical protein